MLSLLWFTRDLRLDDNPALQAALARGAVLPVYVLDDDDAGPWAAGGASRWWLHGALQSLDQELRARGSRLVLRRGRAREVLEKLLASTGADAVYWSRRYEPWALARNEALKTALRARGVQAHSFNALLLREPWELATQQGSPYRVFTPFWKALQAAGVAAPVDDAPARIAAPEAWPASEPLDDWALLPQAPDWAGGLRAAWQPTPAAAQLRLQTFLAGPAFEYQEARNLPGVHGSSRLSPYLHFGQISPRQVWQAVEAAAQADGASTRPAGLHTYLSEIAWREFSYHLLYHYPQLPHTPLRPEFAAFPWAEAPDALRAWQLGQTGYPIVDAGMRELWHTGWMHNRVRMIVASFLIKDLLIPWQTGEQWFWDTLVDADLASNAASWQWVAGCGADAAPYFRVFNPSLQGAKFDPAGSYVRHWVPELARLPDACLHAPWEARPVDLAAARVRLGHDYPAPLVDHAVARQRALLAYEQLRKG